MKQPPERPIPKECDLTLNLLWKMTSLQKLFRLNLKVLGIVKNVTTANCRWNSTSNQFISGIQSRISYKVLSEIKNPWIWQQNPEVETPISRVLNNDLPLRITNLPISEPISIIPNEIEAPSIQETKYEKHAVKLIVIRRHKMRKHKLKKLRKKMKFEWAKRRQRREMKKEKDFQGGLIAKIKEAEAFSAEQYVAEKIQRATETPIPRFWKGKRLPEFLIREKLGLPPK